MSDTNERGEDPQAMRVVGEFSIVCDCPSCGERILIVAGPDGLAVMRRADIPREDDSED